MRGSRLLSLSASILILLMLTACSGGNSAFSAKRATATIKVGFDSKARKSSPKFATIIVGTVSDISSITVDIQDGSTSLVQGLPLTNNNGSWTATVNDLPVGEPLTVTGHAYNSSSTEIFTGTTSQSLTGTDDQIVIAMSPVTNGGTLQFLMISQVSRPAQILAGTTVPVSFSVVANAGETLTYEITADPNNGGSFTAPSGSLTLSGTGTSVTLVMNYAAPAIAGIYSHSLRVTDRLGTSVETSFDTNVASQLTGSAILVQFNPVVTSVTTVRNGSEVTFTAAVSDTGPAGALTYNWSSAAGKTFVDPATNPAVMQGYDETAGDLLTLTVTNGSGGSTTVSYEIKPGQLRSNVVSNVMLLPQVTTNTNISDCRAGGVSGNIVTLSMEEGGDQTDYNNDGDMNDRVLGYFDVSQNRHVNTGITLGAASVSIDGDVMAYITETGTIGYYAISTATARDTGITPDGFDRDYWGVARVVSGGKIAYVAGGLLNIYNTADMQNTATTVATLDPLSLSFSGNIVAFIGPDATLMYHNVSTGLTTDTEIAVPAGDPGTGQRGALPIIDNGIIVFNTLSNQVAYYDISRGLYAVTPIGDHRDHVSISNGVIAVAAIEDSYWGDLNGDGAITGVDILVLYDIATGRMVSTGVDVCCIPDISGWLIAYDGDNGCEHWYVMIDSVIRQYFGR